MQLAKADQGLLYCCCLGVKAMHLLAALAAINAAVWLLYLTSTNSSGKQRSAKPKA